MPASGDFLREIKQGMPQRLQHRLVPLDVVDSTNLYARAHRDALPDEAIVVADEQRSGRGRLDRSWYSERGSSLLMTMIKALPGEPRSKTLMPLAVAVASATAMESVCPDLRIHLKWPNDLIVSGRKVGGILIGAVSPSHGAVGIGINVGEMALPAHLEGKATSLSEAQGKPVRRTALLTAVVDAVDTAVEALLNSANASGAATIPESFTSRMAGLGSVVTFQETAARVPVSGTLEGLRDDGALMIKTPSGIRFYHTGDLTTHLDQRP